MIEDRGEPKYLKCCLCLAALVGHFRYVGICAPHELPHPLEYISRLASQSRSLRRNTYRGGSLASKQHQYRRIRRTLPRIRSPRKIPAFHHSRRTAALEFPEKEIKLVDLVVLVDFSHFSQCGRASSLD